MKNLRRTFIMLMAFIMATVVVSCATYQVSKDFNGQNVEEGSSGVTPLAYIHAKNYGYYLFNIVPIVSGSCESVGNTSWFTDNVNPQNSVDLLTKKANELGASKVVDLASTYRESGIYTLWIFWYRGAQTSGTAVR